MITAQITNIILELDRFKVFARFSNGAEEMNIFMPDATSKDIRAWVKERIDYYTELAKKEEELKEELLEVIIE